MKELILIIKRMPKDELEKFKAGQYGVAYHISAKGAEGKVWSVPPQYSISSIVDLFKRVFGTLKR